MTTYVAPEFFKKAFHCPYCSTFSRMRWSAILEDPHIDTTIFPQYDESTYPSRNVYRCRADCCSKSSYWLGYIDTYQSDEEISNNQGLMIWPKTSTAEQPHEDMPEHIKEDYEEARQVVGTSPRAAAALLRLAIQKLMVELGEKGDQINKDIASLVSKGVPEYIQQALDFCRVTGNNAVHPGVIDLNDTPEMVNTMFSLINIIIHSQISVPKMAKEAFYALPEGARAAIAKRDGITSGETTP